MTTVEGTAIISTIIAGGTLIYTMASNLVTRREVKDLKRIVEELEKGNMVALESHRLNEKAQAASVAPNFKVKSATRSEITFINEGGEAHIEKIDCQLSFSNEFSTKIEHDTELKLIYSTIDTSDKLPIKIFYNDILGNAYEQEFEISENSMKFYNPTKL